MQFFIKQGSFFIQSVRFLETYEGEGEGGSPFYEVISQKIFFNK